MAQFLIIASRSASEPAYQLLLAKDLEYIHQSDYDSLHAQLTEIRKMLSAFITKLKSN